MLQKTAPQGGLRTSESVSGNASESEREQKIASESARLIPCHLAPCPSPQDLVRADSSVAFNGSPAPHPLPKFPVPKFPVLKFPVLKFPKLKFPKLLASQ